MAKSTLTRIVKLSIVGLIALAMPRSVGRATVESIAKPNEGAHESDAAELQPR